MFGEFSCSAKDQKVSGVNSFAVAKCHRVIHHYKTSILCVLPMLPFPDNYCLQIVFDFELVFHAFIFLLE